MNTSDLSEQSNVTAASIGQSKNLEAIQTEVICYPKRSNNHRVSMNSRDLGMMFWSDSKRRAYTEDLREAKKQFDYNECNISVDGKVVVTPVRHNDYPLGSGTIANLGANHVIKKYFCKDIEDCFIIFLKFDGGELYILDNGAGYNKYFYKKLWNAFGHKGISFRNNSKYREEHMIQMFEALRKISSQPSNSVEIPINTGWRLMSDGIVRYFKKDDLTWKRMVKKCI